MATINWIGTQDRKRNIKGQRAINDVKGIRERDRRSIEAADGKNVKHKTRRKNVQKRTVKNERSCDAYGKTSHVETEPESGGMYRIDSSPDPIVLSATGPRFTHRSPNIHVQGTQSRLPQRTRDDEKDLGPMNGGGCGHPDEHGLHVDKSDGTPQSVFLELSWHFLVLYGAVVPPEDSARLKSGAMVCFRMQIVERWHPARSRVIRRVEQVPTLSHLLP